MGLLDLSFQGPIYTRNNRRGENNIRERIDRGLSSVAWLQLYPDAAIHRLGHFQR